MTSDRTAGKGKRKSLAAAPSRRVEFLTPNEVADRLLVAPVTVRLWASRGLLKSVNTPGGHRRFRVKDVEEFVARRQLVHDAAEVHPSRLLIVDDDAQFTRYLASLIATRAPTVLVDVALDGFSAGIKCEAMRPDVVTLDLQMPDMDGFAVCRLLRSMFGARRPRIVALSGYLSDVNVQLIKEAGADAYLPKTSAADLLIKELGLGAPRNVAGIEPDPADVS